MGRFFDFAKRRIVGYILFWTLVLLFIGIFYQGNPPAQAGGLLILGLAFLGSLLYTRRMKRRQRAKREAEERMKQWQEWQRAQQAQYAQRLQQWQAQQAQQAQTVLQQRSKGGR
jgi:hypothetical protein